MQVLVTSPEVDPLTRYLRVWTKRLIARYERTHRFFHLDAGKATREHIVGLLSKKGVALVLLNGHGSDTCIAGDEGILLDCGDTELFKGKTVHALSCQTAKTLGVAAMQAGAKGYVGYDAEFIAVLQQGGLPQPFKDDTATLFLAPAFVAPKALLDGKRPESAVSAARAAYNRSIVEALNSDVQSDNDQFIGWLVWDRDHLKSCEAPA